AVTTWRVIGVLSGTSMDGVDIAACRARLSDGTVEIEPLGHDEISYPDSLRAGLEAALPPATAGAELVCRLDTEIGRCFAVAARRGVELAGGDAELVSSLGQTLFHWVSENGDVQGSSQLGQPAWIAESIGLPVVSD